MIDELKRFLRENGAHEFGTGIANTQDISVLVVTSEWKKETGKSIFILVDNQSGLPRWVAGTMHSAAYNSILEEEFSNLKSIRTTLQNRPLQDQIPAPVYLGNIADRLVLFQTAVQGLPLKIFTGRKSILTFKSRIRNLLGMLFEWIVLFEKSTSGEKKLSSAKTGDRILREIDTYLVSQRVSRNQEAYLKKLRDRIQDLREGFPSPVPQHNDFWVGNVLAQKNKINGVIDWETYEENGIPFSDVFSMVTHINFWLGKQIQGSYLLNEFYLQFHSRWYSEIVSEVFRTYCKNNQINQSLLTLLVPAILIKRANMMASVIKRNSVPIQNTWDEVFRFFVENRQGYLPFRMLGMSDH